MIVVTRSVDTKAGTITLVFDDQGYDHELQGQPCHAVEMDGPDGDALKHHLRLLGYVHIGCEMKPTGVFPWETRHVEYWAKPAPPEGE